MSTATPNLALKKFEIGDSIETNITVDQPANMDTLDTEIQGNKNKFDAITGHQHTGAAGDGPQLDGPAAIINVPAARVFHSANQSIPNDAQTILAFDTERFDTDGIHDTVTNNSRLTAQTAGKYLINAQARFASNATGLRQIIVQLNGGVPIAEVLLSASSGIWINTISTVITMGIGDYVDARVYQDSGGPLNIDASPQYSPEFMMVRVGD